MCAIGTTFTLPGIAGIVLTVGMAVDANVLIYERIREELSKGKSLRGAIAAGYARAFTTIFDSHVTTLISSIILWKMGTGSVKGFGVALTIGVAASLFTALVVTRLIFDFLLARGWLRSIPMLHLVRATKLDFMKVAKPAFVASWLLIFVGVGYGFHRGKSLFGVDSSAVILLRSPSNRNCRWIKSAPRSKKRASKIPIFNIKRTGQAGARRSALNRCRAPATRRRIL